MKTYIDVINETIEYYSQDQSRRAIDWKGDCVYYDHETGSMCAIGRCLRSPKRHSDKSEDATQLFKNNPRVFALMVKPEYRHLKDIQFWHSLQELHDVDEHWGLRGLSEYGKEYVEELNTIWGGRL